MKVMMFFVLISLTLLLISRWQQLKWNNDDPKAFPHQLILLENIDMKGTGMDVKPALNMEKSHSARIDSKRPLKWVFTMVLNERSDPDFIRMCKVAVTSAKKHTTLMIIAMLVVDPKSPKAANLVNWLEERGVTVIKHYPHWADLLLEVQAGDKAKENIQYSPLYGNPDAMLSTWLRMDLCKLGFSDEYILYADVDIIFTREIVLSDFGELPKYYLITVEAQVTAETVPFDLTVGNAGVMLYNVVNMRKTYSAFIKHVFSKEHIDQGLFFDSYGPGDQGAFNSFYRDDKKSVVRLMSFFNWRPYWKGIESVDKKPVAIVHWHGPKPKHYFDYLKEGEKSTKVPEVYKGLLSKCNRTKNDDDCWKWNRIWRKHLISIDDGAPEMQRTNPY